MSAAFYGYFEKRLKADVDWEVDNFKAVLCRLSALTPAKAISAATNATPIVITCTGHGLATGDRVAIVGVGGNTAANGNRKVTVVDANSFSLQTITGSNVAGNGAYTSGGYMIPLESTGLDNLNDVTAGARVSTTANLASKTSTKGVMGCANTSFSSVAAGAACDIVIVYQDTGTESTSVLVAVLDANGGTGLPVTPNGGNINLNFTNGYILSDDNV